MTKKNEVAIQGDNLNAKAVAIKEQAAVMQQQMQEMGIESSDLMIPVLLLQQNTSEAVGNEKAKLGDILNSQTEQVVGGIGHPVELIPLRLFKTIRVYSMAEGKPKFMREEPLSAQNEKMPFEGTEEVEGKKVPVKRYLNFNFFVLLKKEIESDEAFPLIVRFKSTSMPAGKQLATQMFKMAALGRLPYSKTVKLNVKKEKKDTNFFGVFTVEQGDNATDKDKAEAQKWLAMLASVTYKVDDREEEADLSAAGPAKAPTVVEAEVVNGPY